ncbi:MAG: GNAT family N-acyltransferase [Jannaschia sp.]
MDERFFVEVTREVEAVRAAQALRHRVFELELGGRTASAQTGREVDALDPSCDHLLVQDLAHPEHGVVATARFAPGTRYTSGEFDVSRLVATGHRVAETGRTCVHPDYRGGAAGLLLFKGLIGHARARQVRFLVGAASFHGADPRLHLPALRSLRGAALAPEQVRPVAIGPEAIETNGPAERGAMRHVPALIKSYLRAGAWVGDGAWVDRAFDTVDVCILLDMERLTLPPAARLDRFTASA